MKDEIHVVAATDSGYEQHTAVMLASLFYHNPQHVFTIHLLHSDKAEEVNKIKMLVIRKGHSFLSYTINEAKLQGFKITHHVSLATYFRLLIPDLLPSSLKKVIYLDSDLVVLTDIGPMWHTDISGFLGAAVPCFFDRYKQLSMDPAYPYFNAGVMIWNLDELRKEKFTQKAIDYMHQNLDNILFWDQDVINHEMQGRIKNIDPLWNFRPAEMPPESAAKIVHYAGSIKPWTFPQNNGTDKFYFRYLLKTPWWKTCFKNRDNLKQLTLNYVC